MQWLFGLFAKIKKGSRTPLKSSKSYFQHYRYLINTLIYHIFTCDLYLINTIDLHRNRIKIFFPKETIYQFCLPSQKNMRAP